MFGVGLGELIVILIVALIFIKPEKLPEIAKVLARTFNEFKRSSAEVRRTVSDISHEAASSISDAQAAASGDAGKDNKSADDAKAKANDVSAASSADGAHEEKKG